MAKTIAILAPSPVPFEIGGAEKFWWGMRDALAVWGGAFVDLIKLPCREKSFTEIIDSYEAFSRLDLNHFDMLISTKYPAWMARHHNHVVYMQHTLRGLYDTYCWTGLPEILRNPPAKLQPLLALARKPKPGRDDFETVLELCRSACTDSSLPRNLFAFPGPLIREIVHFFDRVALAPGEIASYLAISKNVARRKDYLPEGSQVKILPHPSDLQGFHNEKGRYFFTASRLHSNKRIRLVADAMRHVPLDIPLKIAGVGPELNLLRERFAGDKRIEFLGFVPDQELLDLYAGAICVPYAPIDEDYGLITIEAMHSGKPVITTPDAGGVCEFVENGRTGFIVQPYPPDMGAAMAKLARHPELAEKMGREAQRRVEDINWRKNVEELLDHASAKNKESFLILSPFGADKHGAGGPRRLFHFCEHLSKNFKALLIAYGSQTQSGVQEKEILPGIRQMILPWPKEALAGAAMLAEKTGQSSDDLALARACANDFLLLETIRGRLASARGVIFAHPWLYPAYMASGAGLPIFYDAHNVENDMKAAVFEDAAIHMEVKTLEADLCANADLIFACSRENLERFISIYGLSEQKMRLLPNGCEKMPILMENHELRKNLAFPDAPIIMFLGSDHRPNVDAALEIFELARRLPFAQFLLVGSVCYPPGVAKIPRPHNIHLLGPQSEKVKNLLIRRADLALNPVLSGSGSNLKILEYLAAKTPCLSTPFGARGLPAIPGDALAIAPIEEFTERIKALLNHPPTDEALAQASDFILSKFSWASSFKDLCFHLTTAMDAHASETAH